MDEQVFLQEAEVTVTKTRFIVHGQTYALSGVTSVKAKTRSPRRIGPLILVGLGLITVRSIDGSGPTKSSLVLIALGAIWWFCQKKKHIIVLKSPSGESNALSSKDKGLISRTIEALNQAIGTRESEEIVRQGFDTPGPSERQGYRLGKAFVWIELLQIFMFWNAPIELAWRPLSGVALAVSALFKRPWGWHVLLWGIPAYFVGAVFQQIAGMTASPYAFAFIPFTLLSAAINILSFVYFYRRRAMFGASRRWRWLEHAFPTVVGPESYPPRPSE